MYNRATSRRTYGGRHYRKVHGRPTGRIVPSRSLLTLRRPYSDFAFIGDGAGNVAGYFYSNPTVTILQLTATTSDFPTAVANINRQCGFALSWTLQDVSDITDFVNLFQAFQIRQLDVEFSLMNGGAYNASMANTLPSIAVCYDPNDSGLPADYETITTQQNHRTHQFKEGSVFRYSFVPKAAAQYYRSALANGYGYSNSNSTWFDTNSALAVQFYGLKGWLRNFNSNTTCGLGIRVQVFAHLVGRDVQ